MMRYGQGLRRVHMSTVALLAAFVMLLAGVPANSQTPGTTYELGPGDVLDVSVWGYTDLARTVTIGPDNRIALPLIGSVSTVGTTVDRLRATLTTAYATYILDPHVTVMIKDFRKIRVSMLGQVAHPGVYELPAGAHLLDLIAAAGGLTDTASTTGVQVLRPGEAPTAVDVDRALAGDVSLNVALHSGETLVVPEDLTNVVTIEGQVVHPGRIRLKGNMRVLDALLMAGGLTDRASVTQARLVRATGASQDLLLDDLLLDQNTGFNVPLKAGDTLYIPEELDNKFYVLGDVRAPGAFVIKGQVTMLQAIAMAGGPQPGPGTAKTVYIVRRRGTGPNVLASVPNGGDLVAGPPVTTTTALPNGRGALISADLQAMLRTGDISQDVPVEPGDVVVVPQNKVNGIQTIVSILAGIASIFKPF
ncbi:MAG TPA: SLBB domain-containing protein [bacterium]|nr:SLBB domain-containing protein [bacterium]